MRVNQRDEPIVEEQLFTFWREGTDAADVDDMQTAIRLLCEHLNVEIWRTNATKHGNVELVLREV